MVNVKEILTPEELAEREERRRSRSATQMLDKAGVETVTPKKPKMTTRERFSRGLGRYGSAISRVEGGLKTATNATRRASTSVRKARKSARKDMKSIRNEFSGLGFDSGDAAIFGRRKSKAKSKPKYVFKGGKAYKVAGSSKTKKKPRRRKDNILDFSLEGII